MLASTCSMRATFRPLVNVLVAIVDRLELAPVDRNDSPREKIEADGTARRTARRPRGSPARCRWRKSAIVLKSGISRPVSHISSMLRWVSRSSRRLDWMRLTIAVDVDLQKRRRMIGRADRSPPARRQQTPAPANPARRRTRRSPAPDCLQLRSRQETRGAKRLAFGPRPRQSASSRTPNSMRQDSNPTNVFTQVRRETGKE